MTPAQSFLTLALAILIDIWAIGPPQLGNRLAFVGYLAGLSAGFQGSGISKFIGNTIQGVLNGIASTYEAPVTIGAAQTGLSVLGVLVLLVVTGAMSPKSFKWLGRLAHLDFENFGRSKGASQPIGGRGASGSGGLMSRYFTGSVNVGMVVLAVAFIVVADSVPTKVGVAMHGLIGVAQHIAIGCVTPLNAVVT